MFALKLQEKYPFFSPCILHGIPENPIHSSYEGSYIPALQSYKPEPFPKSNHATLSPEANPEPSGPPKIELN